MLDRDEIDKIISKVMHPAVDLSLVELGMVKDISADGNKVSMRLILPFPNIPILDFLISSLKKPLEEKGAEVNVKIGQMDEQELQYFLKKERENWKGI